ncbi:MAG TPA: hypothetical protein VIM11_06590 [Tepidisphaeraceae bacterium]|jgi:hypothetical protein
MKVGLIELLLVFAAFVFWMMVRPFWTEFLFFGSMTPYFVRQWAAERFGFSIGGCRHCGYNLKANESGICPECGQAADPVTPVREIERPPKLWFRLLLAFGITATLFLAGLITIVLW